VSLKNITKTEPEENGNSFQENALIKARFASKLINYSEPTISDDSGLCIKNLDNSPGIFSSRWAHNNDYITAFKKIIDQLTAKKLVINGQEAKFICVMALVDTCKREYIFEGSLEGTLTFPPKGNAGFGYDPIFIPIKFKKTFAELNPALKNLISHRKKAADKLLKHKLFKNVFYEN